MASPFVESRLPDYPKEWPTTQMGQRSPAGYGRPRMSGSTPSPPAVRVEGVTKSFGATTALAGVDLIVPEGTVFGLLGPNGAGKTTLVRVLATLLTPDTGRAEVFGRDVVADA